MINDFSISEIENISVMQNELGKEEPFRVKYSKDHLWQIYYSELTDRYFMLVCTKEKTFSEFFYLLKKKIELYTKNTKTVPKIYVPINAMSYSERFLNKTEITDLENYLWLFTNDWALIFEVYNKSNEMSIQIVGNTYVYEKVKSSYKIKLNDSDEAIRFYKLLKALFIMQTEIKGHFEFTTQIDSKNNLELYMGKLRITYDNLSEFIENEFKIAEEEIRVQNEQILELEEELEKIKVSVKEKEDEYLLKQKEISTYLEYRKTFFGKMKYFFKSNKINKKIKEQHIEEKEEEKSETKKIINIDSIKSINEKKDYYTIEDLVTIYSMFERGEKNYKNLIQDIDALKLSAFDEKEVFNGT